MSVRGPMESWNDPNEKDARLLVQFFIAPVKMEAKMREIKATTGEDRPLYEDREFVSIRIPGDKNTEIVEEVTFRANTPMDPRIRFAEQYSRFKANAGQQHVGTPLTEWTAMTPARIKMLEYHNIFTIEHLASAADTAIQKLGMDGFELRKSAQGYLLRAKGVDEEKETLKLKAEEQAKQIAEMQAQIAAISAGNVITADAPARRGRPPKAAEAVAA